jgi:penicillin-binding protein 1B
MNMDRKKILPIGALTLFIIFALSLFLLDRSIQSQIKEKSFLSPTQYYASPPKFYLGQSYTRAQLQKDFSELSYRQREFGDSIGPGDYSLGETSQCQPLVPQSSDIFSCVFFRTMASQEIYLLTINEMDQIQHIFQGDDLEPSTFAEGEPQLFAQYLGDQPTSQIEVSLSAVPRYCLESVLAIEDPHFLEHSGVSIRGILRALAANLRQVRWSQGGSTITQQLVKNYFLSPEKTIVRKIKEILISFILELRVSKDQILESYLNVIYLGQSGVFEVRGYGSAAQFYFNKSLDRLNLAECSLLAAIVNSPGRYHPVRHPERAEQRRQRVLQKMVEHHFISEEEKEEAQTAPLPTQVHRYLADSASYYVDAVNKKLRDLGIKNRSGLMVYTALNPKKQKVAEEVIREGVTNFEKNIPRLKQLKEQDSKPLQALLISSDPLTGEVTALVGGRDFASSPYNRAVESRRQVGSIFKPIVYLTALTSGVYTPLTLLDNSPFRYEWDKQIWEPQNYDQTFSRPVPFFYALKESMNVPTARLGIDVGLNNVIHTARELGVKSPLKSYPSLSLGAFEITPLEVVEVYNTLARMGRGRPLQIIKMVQNKQGDILYRSESLEEQRQPPLETAILVGMMKETLRTGTGQGSRWRGFNAHAAGKTGTTSDTKDTWFAGFTPDHNALVWVGYDDGTPLELTGASAALPIWTQYMRRIPHARGDFAWPPGVEKITVLGSELFDLGLTEKKSVDTPLVIRSQNN